MKPIFKFGIGSVIALAVIDKSGIVARLAKSGDAKVHGTEWAEAKYQERRGQAGRRSHCDRCGESTRGGSIMSMRSDQMICRDCDVEEQARRLPEE